MDEKNIVIKYKIQRNYCSCCNQKLPQPKISDAKDFRIREKDAVEWADWQSAAEYSEDIDMMVPEFVLEIIDFWAGDSLTKVIIEKSEIDKVKDFILQEVVVRSEDIEKGGEESQ